MERICGRGHLEGVERHHGWNDRPLRGDGGGSRDNSDVLELSTAVRLNKREEGKAWSSSAAATSLERVPLGFMRDHASRRKSFPTALAVAWGDR